jgi:hypothetical protein
MEPRHSAPSRQPASIMKLAGATYRIELQQEADSAPALWQRVPR